MGPRPAGRPAQAGGRSPGGSGEIPTLVLASSWSATGSGGRARDPPPGPPGRPRRRRRAQGLQRAPPGAGPAPGAAGFVRQGTRLRLAGEGRGAPARLRRRRDRRRPGRPRRRPGAGAARPRPRRAARAVGAGRVRLRTWESARTAPRRRRRHGHGARPPATPASCCTPARSSRRSSDGEYGPGGQGPLEHLAGLRRRTAASRRPTARSTGSASARASRAHGGRRADRHDRAAGRVRRHRDRGPVHLLRPALPRALPRASSTRAPRCSSSRPPGRGRRVAHWTLLAHARAVENQCVVIACNTAGHARRHRDGRPLAGRPADRRGRWRSPGLERAGAQRRRRPLGRGLRGAPTSRSWPTGACPDRAH